MATLRPSILLAFHRVRRINFPEADFWTGSRGSLGELGKPITCPNGGIWWNYGWVGTLPGTLRLVVSLRAAMPSQEAKTGWLLWTAGALAAPAFILPGILVLAGMIHYYSGVGWRVLVSDATMLGAWEAVQVVKSKSCSRWSWWVPCAAAIAILAVTSWLPAIRQRAAFTTISGLILSDLILAAPPIHKRLEKRAEARRTATIPTQSTRESKW